MDAEKVLEMSLDELGYSMESVLHEPVSGEVEETGFVKIIKQDGPRRAFVHVVQDSYHLLCNEHVLAATEIACRSIQSAEALPKHLKPTPWCVTKYFTANAVESIGGDEVSVGFVITNSMNYRLNLSVRSAISIKDIAFIPGGGVYRHKHTKNLLNAAKVSEAAFRDPEKLVKIIEAAIQASQVWASEVRSYHGCDPQDWGHIMESLSEALPNKYLPSYLDKNELKGPLRAELWPATMWDVFKEITRAIWLGNTQETTRLLLMEKVNGIMEPAKFHSAMMGSV